jgi:hypothetical protein
MSIESDLPVLHVDVFLTSERPSVDVAGQGFPFASTTGNGKRAGSWSMMSNALFWMASFTIILFVHL